jgi:hypothetical protein
MGRFNDILKGKRARCTVAFPALLDHGSFLVSREEQIGLVEPKTTEADAAPVPGPAPSVAPEPPIQVDLIVLTGEEEAEVCAKARAFAIGRGVSEPKQGEPLYDLGAMVYTLLLSVVDHDSAAGEERPFFDSAEQILKHLDRERISFLYTLQEAWQDECAPLRKDLSEPELYQWVFELAESEDIQIPFGRLRPSTLWIYMRTLARRLIDSQDLKSLLGPSSGPSTSTATSGGPSYPTGNA